MPTTISVPEAVSNVLMTPSPPEPPGGNNGTQEPPGLEESGKNVSLTLEAIIFLSIGLLLFVILIVLVAILAICIGHRYRSLQRLGRSKARVGSVGKCLIEGIVLVCDKEAVSGFTELRALAG